MRDVLRFQPLYQERVWGGRGLGSALNRTLPPDCPIGESWEIVDRPEAQSVVRDGIYAGRTLRSLIEERAAKIMGPKWPASRPFPILVKWLDCRERLSLQVHPPQSVAAELKGEPKTENWYIAETAPNAHLIVGLKHGVTREMFEAAMASNQLEPLLHRFPVARGDSIFVESGRLHAIDAGNLILEIQQNSDTTYRVYDWGRVGLDGKPRKMHVQESLRSIKWDDFEPAPLRAAPTSGVIADSPLFRIRRVVLDRGERIEFSGSEEPRILSVVSGTLEQQPSGRSADPLLRGDNALLPYSGSFAFTAVEAAIVLVTEAFNGS